LTHSEDVVKKRAFEVSSFGFCYFVGITGAVMESGSEHYSQLEVDLKRKDGSKQRKTYWACVQWSQVRHATGGWEGLAGTGRDTQVLFGVFFFFIPSFGPSQLAFTLEWTDGKSYWVGDVTQQDLKNVSFI
jgi:hypothetical protein